MSNEPIPIEGGEQPFPVPIESPLDLPPAPVGPDVGDIPLGPDGLPLVGS